MKFFPDEYKEPIHKLHLELMQQIGMNESDYFLVASRVTPAILFKYLNYAFAMGSEFEKLNIKTDKKPVICYCDGYSKRFESLHEAALHIGISNPSNIIRSIKTGVKSGKFNWKFA
jgi:hypothetical protein